MRKPFWPTALAVVLGLMLASCGGNSTPSQPSSSSSGMVPVSLTISDNPPAGVTILRFQIQVTGATLQPADTSQSTVSLLSSPQGVELTHLQTESALLVNANVPAGTYNSLTATFANPQMTIFNQTGGTLTVGSQSCATNQVCTLTPTLNQVSISIQAPTSPFPITLSSNSPLALLLHFDVNASVQGDLSVSPMVSVKQIPAPPSTAFGTIHLVGRITAVNSPNFTIQLGFSGLAPVIATDSNTAYNFGNSCAAGDFSCLAVGQVVRVTASLMSGGTLDATNVKLLESKGQPALEGLVLSVNAAQSQFKMVVMDLQQSWGNVWFGFPVTIQVASSATFSVDSDGVTVPPTLSFASISDLVVGQEVTVNPTATPTSAASPTPWLGISVDSVELEASQVTSGVTAVNAGATPPNFILGTLPPLFSFAGISQITVEPVMGTVYENVSGLSSLSVGQTVSVSGLLFNTSGGPTLIPEEIETR
ncbi:MAG TPA: DUF5666 domain-containing protein [Candidatus Acidoferrum sp.]|nr:DUF5666 domain-containing protein [Candidatus Acidoferrum sp.]